MGLFSNLRGKMKEETSKAGLFPRVRKNGVEAIIENDQTPPIESEIDEPSPNGYKGDQSFKESPMGWLFGKRSDPAYPGGTDKNGIPMPQVDKQSRFGSFLNVALPTALGAASGVGAVPGLMAGMKGNYNREKDAKEDAMNNYLKSVYYSSGLDVKNRALDQTQQDEAEKRRIAEENLKLKKKTVDDNASKPRSDFELYTQAKTRMQQALSRGQMPDIQDETVVNEYSKKNQLD